MFLMTIIFEYKRSKGQKCYLNEAVNTEIRKNSDDDQKAKPKCLKYGTQPHFFFYFLKFDIQSIFLIYDRRITMKNVVSTVNP